MTHTAWRLAGLTGVPLALPYAWADGAWDTYGHYGYPDYPDGALRASVSDLGKLLRMVISGGVLGDVSVLPSWAVEAMLSDAVPEVEPGQGLIWYQYDDGGELYWGHEGGDSGVSTSMFFRPSDGLGVIVLTNMDAPESENDPFALYEIEALLYEAADSW
jgi:CubicO group peptidase (beta-lactamase class C family)